MTGDGRNRRPPRLAVLIDADNASPKIAEGLEGLFDEFTKIGEGSVRRIYGDFSQSSSKGWADVLARYAITLHQQLSYTTGKNASDITLVIDDMDLLHSNRFDGFCLVSSDSDFTRLAARTREQGNDAYGFGEQKTLESFRQACRRIFCTENLLPSTDTSNDGQTLQPPSAAVPIINKVIASLDADDGWTLLSTIGHQLAKLTSDFDPRTYGVAKLSGLVRKTGAFELKKTDGGSLRIRAMGVEK